MRLLSLLAELKDVEDAKGFHLLASLFEMASDGDDIISRVQLLVEYGCDPNTNVYYYVAWSYTLKKVSLTGPSLYWSALSFGMLSRTVTRP